MGDGRGDLQRVWHEFVGNLFEGVTILDVGAGIGLSKPRLENGGKNKVTTQDIDRSKMLDVDVISYMRDVKGQWDVVTSFDAIEHAPDPVQFTVEMWERARRAVFFSTPNRHVYSAPWHFYPADWVSQPIPADIRYFLRYRVADDDRVEEVSREIFAASKDAYALGLMLTRKS